MTTGTLQLSRMATGSDPIAGHWDKHSRDLGLEPITARRSDLVPGDASVLYRDDGRRELLIGHGLDDAPEQAVCWVLAHEAGHHALHGPQGRVVRLVEDLRCRYGRTIALTLTRSRHRPDRAERTAP